MRRIFLIPAFVTLLAGPLAAQVALPGTPLPQVDETLETVTETLSDTIETTGRSAINLAGERLRTIERFVRSNRDTIALDMRGEPARRGELLAMDVDAASLGQAIAAGFTVLDAKPVEGLGFAVTRLGVPSGMRLADAERELASVMPEATVSADNLHFQSGEARDTALPVFASATASWVQGTPVGVIDGAPGRGIPVVASKGFALGAPFASNHGSAVVSLLASAGTSSIRVADVYGTDKAGGNALAIARGLGWLVAEGSRVITISLVGPQNPVLARAIAAVQQKGVVVVAAVGNAGPAAPPAYPASYDGVVAVTAVDGKRRVLIEAGHALHLDYAAPGADIRALDAKGRLKKLRGTSFATPLIAARVAQALAASRNWQSIVDGEALDLGKRGPDPAYGRGLVCGTCKGF
jgi:subtilisin family serine protease